MKKIAFLLVYFPAKFQTFVINQILNAHNAGFEIRIFPQYLIEQPKDVSQQDLIERYDLMNKVIKPVPFELNKAKRIKWLLSNVYRRPRKLSFYFIKSLNPFLFGKNGINFLVFRNLLQFHENSDFDIFHCQYGPAGLIAAWLKELGLLKGKIITTFHGYDAHFSDAYLKTFYRSSIRIWSPLLFKHSDLITVCTPFLFEQVTKLGADPNKIEILPLGIDTSFFLPNENLPKPKNIQLLSVGRLVKWKGHDLGIQAVHKLVKEGFDIKYYIIGDGIEKQNLQRYVEKLNLESHVKLLGPKTQSEIKKWLQESDVFLMTSAYDEIGRRETQGVVTAEAQACELPVVAFRSGGIPYTLEDGKTGFLAEEKNVSEFTQHLRKLCINKTLRIKMGKNARKFVEANYCQAKVAKKQISLYEKVLLK